VVLTAAELGYRTILWTIDTIDWQPGRQPETIVSKVVDNAKNGAIILMHPTKPTVQALPEMIRQLQEKKYSFGKVSEVIL
jgi:peptidoglycan/xylan/chitin deacetylase (PgdA/CDA1 family)